jgi:hypothetical protein
LTNATGLPISTGVSGLGTGIATALAVNTGSSGAPVINGGVLGTPSSGTVTNLTGTASININGTVGATTATTGAFTTLSASGAVTLSGATANGVAFANGSKVLTTGSALTFDGAALNITPVSGNATSVLTGASTSGAWSNYKNTTADHYVGANNNSGSLFSGIGGANSLVLAAYGNLPIGFGINSSEQMRLTSTGLGIGTSSPTQKLDVNGKAQFASSGATGTANTLTFGASGNQLTFNYGGANYINCSGTGATIDISSNSGTTFSINNSIKATLDTSGNLGLGVTPSAWVAYKALQVGSTGGALSSSSSSDFEITTNAYYSGGWLSQGAGVASSRYRLLSGTHAWFNAPSGTAGNAITFTQAMTLDASGNLGVGTTSNPDTARLHVSKASGEVARFSSPNGTSSYITLGRNDATGEGMTLGYSSSTGDCTISTITTHPLIFRTNNTERARIDSSGNLLVGTTSGGNRKLEVVTTGTNHAISCLSDTAGYATIECINSAASGTRNFIGFRASRGGADVGSITYNGTLTAYNTTSDYRLKTVHGAVTGHGSRIDALEPVEYTWNANGTRTRGFLAHKFQEVYAGSVTGEKDAVDADGNPVYQAMQASTAEVIADLVAEIQSLRQRLSAANL